MAAPTITVVDTVGAGDSFMGGLLAAMADDGAIGRHAATSGAALTEPTVARWMQFATMASAITCTRKGANPPMRDEVVKALEPAATLS